MNSENGPHSLRPFSRQGVTLIELQVVFAIIGVLVALILPAVQAARKAARRMTCQNNLKQIGLAVHNYQSAHRVFPPGGIFTGTTSWSAHGRIMPYLEQSAEFQRVRLDLDWHHPFNLATGVQKMQIPVFVCPSDPLSDDLYFDDEGEVRPINYGFNFGSWFVFDPRDNTYGDGCFHVNARMGPQAITDGLSNTLCMAEVKTFTSYFRNTANPGPTVPPDANYLALFAGGAQFKLGPGQNDNAGHTEWCDSPVHESGFTTVFAPNQKVPYLHSDGRTYDIDYNSRYEGTSWTEPTYAAVTSRSHHAGMVHAMWMDGSVRTTTNSVDLKVWRAMGTRNGHEVSPAN
ncbi:DUF1559 family PulG-like putative transporter [Crateriforma conspicua]|uniref:DUF1559 family PulG-like putative transporter n=1 Tax=Crateriforma conspicua TaxID=2527996 RepID=UPI0011B800A2|nr:DUF1559 domain-containing protein [Crateriforma conspicua]